jgi:hypothetical protein
VATLTLDASGVLAVPTEEPSRSARVAPAGDAALAAPASIHREVGNAPSAMLKP